VEIRFEDRREDSTGTAVAEFVGTGCWRFGSIFFGERVGGQSDRELRGEAEIANSGPW